MHLYRGHLVGKVCAARGRRTICRGPQRRHRRLAALNDGTVGAVWSQERVCVKARAIRGTCREIIMTMSPAPRPRHRPYSLAREVLEREVIVEAYRSGGPGGQHRNVTDSAVRLRHVPSGVRVTAADSRSQTRNKDTAFARLIERLREL